MGTKSVRADPGFLSHLGLLWERIGLYFGLDGKFKEIDENHAVHLKYYHNWHNLNQIDIIIEI